MVDENSTIEDWQVLIDRYKKHNTDVLEYFLNKSGIIKSRNNKVFFSLRALSNIREII